MERKEKEIGRKKKRGWKLVEGERNEKIGRKGKRDGKW